MFTSGSFQPHQLQPIVFPSEPISFSAPGWSEMYQLTFDLATQIKAGGETFDRVVTLAKGGWSMTVSLVDLLMVKNVASIGVKFYAAVNQRLGQPEIYQGLSVSVAGENILLFDDIADTGTSLKFVTQYLLDHGAKSVKTAVLIYKPHSSLKPDFYVAQTSTWIIFPYDLVDSVGTLGGRWLAAGLTLSEVETRLQQFGFKLAWLRPYTQSLLLQTGV